MNEIVIREAKLYDVPALARIERDNFAHPWTAEQITDDIVRNKQAYVAVAMAGDERAGYADIWMVAGEAELYNIVVDEPFRGRHIGEMLLDHMVNKCLESGCEVLRLEVRRSNEPAISLYNKKGFVRTGLRRGYYSETGEDAVLMDKTINALDADYNIDFEVEVQTI